ncbi:ATP synthase epsilon chain [hydrothermal vent metagenome]|uniref:ATP synthase epsilon chain n=1 Tax=hydrothermal vent metagenome TaxID=652676 RepID=A0A3B0RWZ5_9ZZZZ
MADKLHFELVSPEKLLMSLSVDMVVVPGVDGDFGVLINHAPVVSTLRTGILEVHNGDTPEKILVVSGFAEVNPDGLTVLAEEAIHLADVDRSALEADLKNAEEDIADAKDEVILAKANKARDRLVDILAVLDLAA